MPAFGRRRLDPSGDPEVIDHIGERVHRCRPTTCTPPWRPPMLEIGRIGVVFKRHLQGECTGIEALRDLTGAHAEVGLPRGIRGIAMNPLHIGAGVFIGIPKREIQGG